MLYFQIRVKDIRLAMYRIVRCGTKIFMIIFEIALADNDKKIMIVFSWEEIDRTH